MNKRVCFTLLRLNFTDEAEQTFAPHSGILYQFTTSRDDSGITEWNEVDVSVIVTIVIGYFHYFHGKVTIGE